MALPNREAVLEMIRELKAGSRSMAVPHGQTPVVLDPVTWPEADDEGVISLLAAWRTQANAFFPAQFPVTLAGTHRWLVKQLLEVPERVLFWVRALDGKRIGHLGLFRFDFDDRSVELDNVIRGVNGAAPGAMFTAVQTLARWSFESLGMQALCLRVLSDNTRAIRLYERCGFQETMRMPLVRVAEGEVVRWEEARGDYRRPVERYFVTMRLLATAAPRSESPAGPHFSKQTSNVTGPTR
ncbi:MAG TPA: GNAT family N-acetyltransferase [Pirellulales bacterium]|jgi:RimJ/RimL family protein N-acetyltransferase|nr:GNAT family N-acetyltransferase [Pirellulales bacterium]